VDGRTDRHDEAIVTFRNFAKALKNCVQFALRETTFLMNHCVVIS